MKTFIRNKSQTAAGQSTGMSNERTNERTYNQLEMELQKKKNEYRNGMENNRYTIAIRIQTVLSKNNNNCC